MYSLNNEGMLKIDELELVNNFLNVNTTLVNTKVNVSDIIFILQSVIKLPIIKNSVKPP